MFIKGKSFGGTTADDSASSNGDSPRKANGDQGAKPEKRRKSIIRSLRNSIIAMTGGSPRDDSSSDVKRRLAAKKANDDRKSRELQHDFVNFRDIEDRRQAELEEDEEYYKLTDIVIKSKEEMKMTQRTVKNQSSHIHDHRQRLKHVTDRLDANDEVASAFENLLMMMVKNLEESGKWTEELQEHIDSIESAKRRRGSITEFVSEIDMSEGDSISGPNTPRESTITNDTPDRNGDIEHFGSSKGKKISKSSYNKVLQRMMSFDNSTLSHGAELAYADFVPKFLTSTSVEPFDTILARVKQWLQACEPHVKVINIETVILPLDAIRTGSKASQGSNGTTNTSSGGSTALAECLRVWIDARSGYPQDWPGRVLGMISLPNRDRN